MKIEIDQKYKWLTCCEYVFSSKLRVSYKLFKDRPEVISLETNHGTVEFWDDDPESPIADYQEFHGESRISFLNVVCPEGQPNDWRDRLWKRAGDEWILQEEK